MCTNSNTQPSNGQQLSPDAFIENSQNDTQKMNTFTAYEKAIEGYQFQVGRYNIWMNYYAIFVGALFVALYSIWPKKRNRNAMLRMQTGLRQSSCGSCRIAGVVLAPDYIRSRLDRLPLLVRSLARVP